MYFVYAIYSEDRDYLYVGISNDVQRRLLEHNRGYNKTTKPYSPFRLIYQETFPSRPLVRIKEKQLKTSTGKRFLHLLITQHQLHFVLL